MSLFFGISKIELLNFFVNSVTTKILVILLHLETLRSRLLVFCRRITGRRSSLFACFSTF